MSRPRKRRLVCALPKVSGFGPLGRRHQYDIIITVDEYETIRLIDYEGMTQEECAKMMNVARTTVQKIYIEARQKIARALVTGKSFKIEGGDYDLCDYRNNLCHQRQCLRRGRRY